MANAVGNGFIWLEFADDGKLLSFRNLSTGTDFAAPHGLWRLVCNCGDDPEVELSLRIMAFRKKHADMLGNAKFRSDALHSSDTDVLYSAGYPAPAGSWHPAKQNLMSPVTNLPLPIFPGKGALS